MSAAPAPALAATDVAFAYRGGAPVLDGVSLALRSGEVVAILGPNGAGKSTLLRLLAGLLPPTAGEVALGGQMLSRLRPREVARRIAVVLEAPELAFSWTAFELVLMGRTPHLRPGRFESDDDARRALEALERVDARALAGRPYQALSAGERQRVLIARALAQDTEILLLDEPTSHLDPAHALAIAALLRGLAAEGRAVGVVLHDLNLAARAADRLALLTGGALRAEGRPEDVLTPPLLAEVYGVRARRVDGPEGVAVMVTGRVEDQAASYSRAENATNG